MMTKTLIPQLAPQLLLRPVDDRYAYAVNCAVPHSFRVLNHSQFQILKAINGKDDLTTIATRLSITPTMLASFLALMSKSELVGFSNDFSTPQKPAAPTSLNFWIHTTDACNLGCSYCYISTLNTSKGMSVPVQRQLLSKLVETVVRRKTKHIKFRLAGGEPLTQFQTWKSFIPDVRQALMNVGCQSDFAFLSNLTLLTPAIIDFSLEYQISFGVSVDGLGPTHDQTRKFRSGTGSFTSVNNHLRQLLTAGIPVSITTVVNNGNLEGLPQLTRYLIDLDVPFRYSIVKGEHIDADTLEKGLSESFSIMANAIDEGWSFSKCFQFCDLKPHELGFQTCASGFSGGAIYTDGTLKYCHVHFGDDNQPSHSIFEEELDLVDMIERGSHPEDNKAEDCQKCRFRFVCTSGCPVYRIEGKDPQCSLYHTFIPLYYELLAKERLKLLKNYTMIL